MNDKKDLYYHSLFEHHFTLINEKHFLLTNKGVKIKLEKPVKINEKYTAMRYFFLTHNKQQAATGYIYLNDLASFQTSLIRLLQRFDEFEKKQNSLSLSTQSVHQLHDVG